METRTSPRTFLLLRDGHAVPIPSLCPKDLKLAARDTIVRDASELRHQARLNAIVQCLGFKGDFGDYANTHWPRVEAFLAERGLTDWVDLFEVPKNPLLVGRHQHGGFARRALADRLFESGRPWPRRVFTGYGHDWDAWWVAASTSRPMTTPDEPVPEDLDAARRWIYGDSHLLQEIHNFLGDQLLDIEPPGEPVLTEYWPAGSDPARIGADRARTLEVLAAFRGIIARTDAGWIDLLPLPETDRVAVLIGPNGRYDLVWRALRPTPPPTPTHIPESSRVAALHPVDRPGAMQRAAAFATWNYYRQEVWDERERHLAEQHHYASGGQMALAYPGRIVVLERYLRATGVYGDRPRLAESAQSPPGFRRVTGPAGDVLVSPLVTIAELRAMMVESGYADRRPGDLWQPGNDQDDGALPAAATWYDAQAYCAWMERALEVSVRLPRFREYRAWRPLRDRYDAPPRCVRWLEPWGGRVGEPARCEYALPLPWEDGPAGLRWVDALDFYEWCDDGQTVSGVHDTAFGELSWGAYKRAKVGFRVVLELAPR